MSLLVQQEWGTIERLPEQGTVFYIILEEQPAIALHAISPVN
ncbi:MAG: hypothetical protein WC593_13425 [Methanoregula sp.]